jgi:hypothetical protein
MQNRSHLTRTLKGSHCLYEQLFTSNPYASRLPQPILAPTARQASLQQELLEYGILTSSRASLMFGDLGSQPGCTWLLCRGACRGSLHVPTTPPGLSRLTHTTQRCTPNARTVWALFWLSLPLNDTACLCITRKSA